MMCEDYGLLNIHTKLLKSFKIIKLFQIKSEVGRVRNSMRGGKLARPEPETGSDVIINSKLSFSIYYKDKVIELLTVDECLD